MVVVQRQDVAAVVDEEADDVKLARLAGMVQGSQAQVVAHVHVASVAKSQ